MVNFSGTACVKRLMATAAKVGLWGSTDESTFEKVGQDILASDLFEDKSAKSGDLHCYIYQPGDTCNVIEEADGIHLLWLKSIQPNEISLRITRNGKVQVSYKGEPVIRMRGIDLIRTEDGCYSLDYWLTAA